ncbi:MAG: hypothetical protein ACREQ9_06190 [Candidatus Binatia bacterium]
MGFTRSWSGTDADLDYGQVDRWIAGWAERRDVPMIALGPLLARAGRRRVFWRHDAHLSPSGHVVVADALYGFLAEHGAPATETASAP